MTARCRSFIWRNADRRTILSPAADYTGDQTMKDDPKDKPQPVPPDKGPKPPVEIPPDQPGRPADEPNPPPKGDPPPNEPTRLVDSVRTEYET